MKKVFAMLFSVVLAAAMPLCAQVSHGGAPLFNHSSAKVKSEVLMLPTLDNERYLQEDLSTVRGVTPLRVGVVQPTQVEVLQEAYKIKDEKGVHYLLTVVSPEATFMNLGFSTFELAEGAQLFFYDETGDFVLGSFVASDVMDDGAFYTQAIPGSVVQIEYSVPAGVEPGRLVLSDVTHGYKDIFNIIEGMYEDQAASLKGPHGDAEGNCHINVACEEGDDWRDQIRSVVALQIRVGYASFMCSGAIINNARMDKTPYILSAHHCQDLDEYGTITGWITYFLYQTNTCTGVNGPSNKSMSGANIKAKWDGDSGSDFLLLKLKSDIPDSYTPYYAGWDWNTVSSHTPGAAIHHPGGDYKKISIPKSINGLSGQMNKFYSVYWYTGANNKGVTEQGSSGSPLFNSDKRIVGQLYAGTSACDYMSGADYYGRLSSSRKGNNTNSGALMPYLDPDSTGIMQLDGMDYTDAVAIESTGEKAMQELRLFPNPSSGSVHFDVCAMGQANYKVFDLQGRCVREGRTILGATHQGLNLSGLPNGSYVLHLHTASGSYKASLIIKK